MNNRFFLCCILLTGLLAVLIAGCASPGQPQARFTVTPQTGDTDTAFQFNASASRDTRVEHAGHGIIIPENAANLKIRWDWESDGVWDTLWATGKQTSHRFWKAGTLTATMQLLDPDGKMAEETASISVTPAGAGSGQPAGATAIMNETFEGDTPGINPNDWEDAPDGEMFNVVDTVTFFTSQSLECALIDPATEYWAGRLELWPTTDETVQVTWKAGAAQTTANGLMYMASPDPAGSATPLADTAPFAITHQILFADDGNIVLSDSHAEDALMSYTPNTAYTFRAVVHTSSTRYDLYVNDMTTPVRQGLPYFDPEALHPDRLYFGMAPGGSGTFWMDDLEVWSW